MAVNGEKREAAEARYIGGDITLKELAAEVGVSLSTLRKWKKAGEWDRKRGVVHRRAMEKAVNKKARELCRLLEASDAMEYALLLAARAVAKNLGEDEEGLMVTDGKERADNLTRIVRAISQQAETRMMLSGILTEAEQEKLELLRRKQELDEKTAVQKDADENEIAVRLEKELGEAGE